jgi:hypothetical protein
MPPRMALPGANRLFELTKRTGLCPRGSHPRLEDRSAPQRTEWRSRRAPILPVRPQPDSVSEFEAVELRVHARGRMTSVQQITLPYLTRMGWLEICLRFIGVTFCAVLAIEVLFNSGKR